MQIWDFEKSAGRWIKSFLFRRTNYLLCQKNCERSLNVKGPKTHRGARGGHAHFSTEIGPKIKIGKKVAYL